MIQPQPTLEHRAVSGELAQAVTPSQPWRGGKIVMLARDDPPKACLRCGAPAHWRTAPEYNEFE